MSGGGGGGDGRKTTYTTHTGITFENEPAYHNALLDAVKKTIVLKPAVKAYADAYERMCWYESARNKLAGLPEATTTAKHIAKIKHPAERIFFAQSRNDVALVDNASWYAQQPVGFFAIEAVFNQVQKDADAYEGGPIFMAAHALQQEYLRFHNLPEQPIREFFVKYLEEMLDAHQAAKQFGVDAVANEVRRISYRGAGTQPNLQ
jgi:hypothetical protein